MDDLVPLMMRVSELTSQHSHHDTNDFCEGIRIASLTTERNQLLDRIHELKEQLQISPEEWSDLCERCYLAYN